MAKFFENPSFPDYLKKREDFERLRDYQGDDSSIEIFPHLDVTWWKVKEESKKSGKPVGDLGASFSTLPVEGELQGIKIYPVDIMHTHGRDSYETILESRMINARMSDAYAGKPVGLDKHGNLLRIMDKPITTSREYGQRVYEAIEKVKANYIVADLAKIPLADRFFCITILHDSIPKHSKDWNAFMTEQLPEILRVTDSAAYVYPMSIYKTEGRELTETNPLFSNPDMLKLVRTVAALHNFTFDLRRAGYNTLSGGVMQREIDARSGMFQRIKGKTNE